MWTNYNLTDLLYSVVGRKPTSSMSITIKMKQLKQAFNSIDLVLIYNNNLDDVDITWKYGTYENKPVLDFTHGSVDYVTVQIQAIVLAQLFKYSTDVEGIPSQEIEFIYDPQIKMNRTNDINWYNMFTNDIGVQFDDSYGYRWSESKYLENATNIFSIQNLISNSDAANAMNGNVIHYRYGVNGKAINAKGRIGTDITTETGYRDKNTGSYFDFYNKIEYLGMYSESENNFSHFDASNHFVTLNASGSSISYEGPFIFARVCNDYNCLLENYSDIYAKTDHNFSYISYQQGINLKLKNKTIEYFFGNNCTNPSKIAKPIDLDGKISFSSLSSSLSSTYSFDGSSITPETNIKIEVPQLSSDVIGYDTAWDIARHIKLENFATERKLYIRYWKQDDGEKISSITLNNLSHITSSCLKFTDFNIELFKPWNIVNPKSTLLGWDLTTNYNLNLSNTVSYSWNDNWTGETLYFERHDRKEYGYVILGKYGDLQLTNDKNLLNLTDEGHNYYIQLDKPDNYRQYAMWRSKSTESNHLTYSITSFCEPENSNKYRYFVFKLYNITNSIN